MPKYRLTVEISAPYLVTAEQALSPALMALGPGTSYRLALVEDSESGLQGSGEFVASVKGKSKIKAED